ncbi:MAG: hypothetical protein QM204_02445 [Bacillota bacterium]|jgi:uncharacterized membrane protein HdeD (DUF308 family)|nr:hypothetical protein [Bacillota bacterium]NLL25817.1 hypothetical protein [Erysipelotrichia bacterium]
MKKWPLFTSVLQLVVGIAAIIAYVYLVSVGESTGKWTITLFLAVGYVVLGIIGIIDYNKSKID